MKKKIIRIVAEFNRIVLPKFYAELKYPFLPNFQSWLPNNGPLLPSLPYTISILLFSSTSALFLYFYLYFNMNTPSELSIDTAMVNGILFSMWDAVEPSCHMLVAGRSATVAVPVRRLAVTAPAGSPGLPTVGESKTCRIAVHQPIATDTLQDRLQSDQLCIGSHNFTLQVRPKPRQT